MIAPLAPFGIRGAIWYQGESNRLRPEQYRYLFPQMIADWRRHWGGVDFPFYFVQIAPYRYRGELDDVARLRDAQAAAMAVPETGMAVTMDIGNLDDIHPKHKQAVGERLARWALARTYGQAIVPSGPIFRTLQREGDRVRLWFDHSTGGLQPTDEPLTEFAVAGDDRVFHPAEARVEGETVVVSCAAVPEPVAVRFAFTATAQPNLRNADGLPAAPFRSDDWD
jgi:sialate O-acetylesterase